MADFKKPDPVKSSDRVRLVFDASVRTDIRKRLERRGVWKEARVYRDQTRYKLMSSGFDAKAATAESWVRMVAMYDPFGDPESGEQKTDFKPALERDSKRGPRRKPESEEERNPSVDAMLEELGSGSVDVARDILWAYDQRLRRSSLPSEAPSRGAWDYLQLARKNERPFLEKLVPQAQAVMAGRGGGVDERVNIREEKKSIMEIRKVLRQHVEAAKRK